jgi:CBS domain-containing protein
MPLIKQLQETEPFKDLPESVFSELREAAVLKKYPANHDIFNQNDSPTGYLYGIKEGLVTITLVSPGGIDMVVDYRKEGQFFGGTPIFTGEPYAGGARTVKPTVCYLIPAEILQRLQKDNPQLVTFFTSAVLSRVRKLYSEIVTEHSGSALNQMEAFPFKKRLSEIMTSPALTCSPEVTVKNVARQLTEHNVSFLVVVDERNTPVGVVTGSDLVAKVLAPENVDTESLVVKDVMRVKPKTMTPETYMYEAMAYMTRHGLNYLPIVDREQLVGVITPRDLLRYRSQKALLLLGNIKEEATIEGLASIHKEMVRVARALLSETRSTPEVMEILSHIHHAIIRRTFQICLTEMAAEGLTPPDIRYCFLIMGFLSPSAKSSIVPWLTLVIHFVMVVSWCGTRSGEDVCVIGRRGSIAGYSIRSLRMSGIHRFSLIFYPCSGTWSWLTICVISSPKGLRFTRGSSIT